MRVLVTGHSGAMGTLLLRELSARRYDVNGIDRNLRGGLTERQVDVSSADEVADAINEIKPDCIVHLAALIADLEKKSELALRVNCVGTLNVVSAAIKARTSRVICTSTRSVYGTFEGKFGWPTYEPVPETYRCAPRNLYGTTKNIAEQLGAACASQQPHCEVIFTRQSWTFGPGKTSGQGIVSIYSAIIEAMSSGRPLEIPGGGEQKNDIIYNGDVARGLCALVDHPGRLRHSVYNISSGVGITFVEFVKAVGASLKMDTSDISITPGFGLVGFHPQGFGILDNNRLVNDTGFVVRPLEENIKDYVGYL